MRGYLCRSSTRAGDVGGDGCKLAGLEYHGIDGAAVPTPAYGDADAPRRNFLLIILIAILYGMLNT